MWKEFKEFAMKGNVMDLAVGVVIGGAFQKIVTSLVEDIIMPCISILTGKIDFSDMVFTVGNASIKYGNFITTIVNFLIISFSIFLVIRYINKINNKKFKDLNDRLVQKIDKNGNLKKIEKVFDHSNKKKKNKNKVEEPAPEPETKICPYCLTEIKYKATRCPHCTSILEEETENNNSNSKLDEENK